MDDLMRQAIVGVRGSGVQSGVMSGQLSVATPAQRLCGVPSALTGTEAALSGLAQALGTLSDRLEQAGVLLPSPPQAASSTPTPPNFQTSLANTVDRYRAQVHSLTAAVNDLVDRIDL